uniref:Mitochondrial translational initiation factor 3 n=1 Tax=Hucho hucho TaxID=62062 RepID=A0A4W5P1F6_9TELE
MNTERSSFILRQCHHAAPKTVTETGPHFHSLWKRKPIVRQCEIIYIYIFFLRICSCFSIWKLIVSCLRCMYSYKLPLLSLSNVVMDETGEGQVPNKKQDPRARAIGSLGRKIQQRHLQVISETGENMVTMHRADVLRLMDENGLKLVPQRKQDPPVYRLMTGKQIHEAQLKLGEKQKAKTAVKELTFSSDIGNHDLLTKLRQVQNWLDKKHHVRITLRTGCMEHAHSYLINGGRTNLCEASHNKD